MDAGPRKKFAENREAAAAGHIRQQRKFTAMSTKDTKDESRHRSSWFNCFAPPRLASRKFTSSAGNLQLAFGHGDRAHTHLCPFVSYR